jgi:hypothetical protein
MGRPKIEIDWPLLDQLLGIFCTGEECAAILDIDYDTLQRKVKEEKKMTFTEYSEIKKGTGRASLRRRQFRMAETNPAMAIWLGKQYLDQRDEQYLKGPGKNGEFKLTIEIADENKIASEAGNRISQYIEI